MVGVDTGVGGASGPGGVGWCSWDKLGSWYLYGSGLSWPGQDLLCCPSSSGTSGGIGNVATTPVGTSLNSPESFAHPEVCGPHTYP